MELEQPEALILVGGEIEVTANTMKVTLQPFSVFQASIAALP
jgi:hypothetical protein